MNRLLQIKKRGSAIALATLAVIILLAMGTGLLRLGLHSRIISLRTTSDIAARCAADTGLTIALYQMNEKLQVPWSGSSLPTAGETSLLYCDASYSYSVTGDLIGGYIIESVGKSGNAERTVYATIDLEGLFENAILTKQNMILKPNTLVDGYNSQDPFDIDFKANIGTQSTADSSVILNSGVVVDGDVIVGLGGDPSTVIKDLGATTGDQLGGTEYEPLPLITPPALPYMGTDITATGETVTLDPTKNGQYGNITVAKSEALGILEISGGDVVLYLTGNIELGESCEIVVNDGSSLTLYIDGDIHCRTNSAVNNLIPPEDPMKVQLFGTAEGTQYFDIKAKTTWSATIYAPNANVDLYANGDFYGSVVADNFELKAGGNYHYDEALREVAVEDEGVRFVVKRWHE